MKLIYAVFLLLFTLGSLYAGISEHDDEAQWISHFLQAQAEGDEDEIWTSVQKLSGIGGPNAARAMLPYLEYNPAVSRAQKSPYPNPVVLTVGDRYLVAEALQQIGLPMETCLTEISSSSPNSTREKLLARIASKHYGQEFVSNVVARAKSEGERWYQVEHLCIPDTTVSTNGVWPVCVQLMANETGLTVTISNYLASAISIPGAPLSQFRNSFRIYTNSDKPRRFQEFGTEYDNTLNQRSSDWYCSIPPQESHTFSMEWSSITNLCPIEVWSSAWQIRWEVYDDLHHGFLSNPIPMTSLPIHN